MRNKSLYYYIGVTLVMIMLVGMTSIFIFINMDAQSTQNFCLKVNSNVTNREYQNKKGRKQRQESSSNEENTTRSCQCEASRLINRHNLDKSVNEIIPGASTRYKPLFFYDDIHQFVDYAETPRLACHEVRYMGGYRHPNGVRDGDKAVCLSETYSITPGDCIVYSFGISDDWSFDDAMAGFGCQVYSFDHTINLPSHNRSENVHFYNIGVSGNEEMNKTNDTRKNVMTLPSIMKMLGHTNKVIDYVKLDIEFSEFLLLLKISQDPKWLLQIKQIGIEIHPGSLMQENFYNLFVFLEYLGFSTFDARRSREKALWFQDTKNPNLTLSQCYEMAFAQVDSLYW